MIIIRRLLNVKDFLKQFRFGVTYYLKKRITLILTISKKKVDVYFRLPKQIDRIIPDNFKACDVTIWKEHFLYYSLECAD